ncbi:NAD(P)H-dependent oxidoreductase [Aestuariibaculum sp. M13]|uniref:NAD(P)H-dependent oxidoreductase n=1 Tax=Aestuariibaculum sp. M13 TaxID=2967132 RepID=UPI002159F5EA|nr:NAD(P)H-dependent oxidoreductase [Aestuariibaculum sp. M13]MCR8667422.1 NAD(P)H-dependent oxidoreductase [Aestuariibaculum sp. M13]
MSDKRKVLLINTHLSYQNWSEGNLNAAFQQKAKEYFLSKDFEVLETKIEDGYTPAEEVEKHMLADLVILQTPVNWFGAPWIYKKYVDEVFNEGLFSKRFQVDDGRTKEDPSKQYGTGGKMYGKKFMISATWNAPRAAFGDESQALMRGKTTSDLFLNISSSYRFVGYDILPDYNCFDIYKGGNPSLDLDNYPKYIEAVLEESEEILVV